MLRVAVLLGEFLNCGLRGAVPKDGASRQTSLEATRGKKISFFFLSMDGIRTALALGSSAAHSFLLEIPPCPAHRLLKTTGSRPVGRVQLGSTRVRGDARVISSQNPDDPPDSAPHNPKRQARGLWPKGAAG